MTATDTPTLSITVAEEAIAAAESHWGGHMSAEVWDAIGDTFKRVAANGVTHASDLSCQGLTDVIVDSDHDNGSLPTFHGEAVVAYYQELERRGEDHVFSCDLIGHMPERQCEGECGTALPSDYRDGFCEDCLRAAAKAF